MAALTIGRIMAIVHIMVAMGMVTVIGAMEAGEAVGTAEVTDIGAMEAGEAIGTTEVTGTGGVEKTEKTTSRGNG